jgi:hypothetical protein
MLGKKTHVSCGTEPLTSGESALQGPVRLTRGGAFGPRSGPFRAGLNNLFWFGQSQVMVLFPNG